MGDRLLTILPHPCLLCAYRQWVWIMMMMIVMTTAAMIYSRGRSGQSAKLWLDDMGWINEYLSNISPKKTGAQIFAKYNVYLQTKISPWRRSCWAMTRRTLFCRKKCCWSVMHTKSVRWHVHKLDTREKELNYMGTYPHLQKLHAKKHIENRRKCRKSI